ncbi:DNA/RNA polymerases superfamily protein [Gossypium australe]|uniref:DNA/RNA polymerases superfamily protein n=1 Tax=Gossypium australe TaxID=47621 RepID=A0A5B6VBH1_9ROSI|nr:DNA/RNA polymerases superfamily protein [Gossypium australe]
MDCQNQNEPNKDQNAKFVTTPTRGRQFGNSNSARVNQSGAKDKLNKLEARVPARTYAVLTKKNLPVESTDCVVKVMNPLGHSVIVDLVCKQCLLKNSRVDLICPDGEIISIRFDKTDGISSMISKLVRKSCDAFLAYILDSKVPEKKVDQVPTTCEFLDVFSKELSGFPREREVEFAIDLIPGTTLASIPPYRMTLTKSKKLKAQLQELLDMGFIRLSVSPSRAPVLFVKMKDGSMRLCIDYQ